MQYILSEDEYNRIKKEARYDSRDAAERFHEVINGLCMRIANTERLYGCYHGSAENCDDCPVEKHCCRVKQFSNQ